MHLSFNLSIYQFYIAGLQDEEGRELCRILQDRPVHRQGEASQGRGGERGREGERGVHNQILKPWLVAASLQLGESQGGEEEVKEAGGGDCLHFS